jgi:hypothetical protein
MYEKSYVVLLSIFIQFSTTSEHVPQQGLLEKHYTKKCLSQPPKLSSAHAAVSNTAVTKLAYEVRIASSAAELRAAAYLRAYSFYHYPEGRSVMAARVSTVQWYFLT